jgi:hypothetical protein
LASTVRQEPATAESAAMLASTRARTRTRTSSDVTGSQVPSADAVTRYAPVWGSAWPNAKAPSDPAAPSAAGSNAVEPAGRHSNVRDRPATQPAADESVPVMVTSLPNVTRDADEAIDIVPPEPNADAAPTASESRIAATNARRNRCADRRDGWARAVTRP